MSEGLNLTETLNLTEKLQRAEARALAAEMAVARIGAITLDGDCQPIDDPDLNAIREHCHPIELTAAREVLHMAEQFQAIESAFPTTYPCRHGEVTGVSVLDDVKDLILDVSNLRTSRNELAALVEPVREGLVQAFGRITVWNDDIKAKVMPMEDDRTIAEIERLLELSRNSATALADLKARVRREALEEAAKAADVAENKARSDSSKQRVAGNLDGAMRHAARARMCVEFAAELRRMAGGQI